MLRRFGWRTPMLCLAFLAAATAAMAQQATGSFEELRTLVKPGDTVTISDTSGDKVTGPIAVLSSSSLELQVGDVRHSFSEADIRAITQRRHANRARGAKRGFFIGEGIAVVSALGCAAMADCQVNWWLVAFGGAGGAGIGVAVSTMRSSERVVYISPRTASTNVTVSPLLTADRRGAFVALRF